MATLITGAGLIGSHAARLLVERDEPTWLYDLNPDATALASVVDPARVGLIRGDVEDLAHLEQVLREQRIDRILHTAAYLTAGMRQDLVRGIRTNVVGTVTALEAARRAGVRRVVLCSSSTVYYAVFDDPAVAPCPEDFSMRVLSQRPESFYAATKLSVEHFGLLYSDQYGVDVVVIRPAAVLGLSSPAGGITGRLIRALLEPAIRGGPSVIEDPLLVWRGGDEFVDVRDAAAGGVAALFADRPQSRVYSIGTGTLYTFEDFVRAAGEAVPGCRVEVRARPTGGFAGYRRVRSQPSDIGAAKRELGWTPRYDLAATMKECTAYLTGRRANERT